MLHFKGNTAIEVKETPLEQDKASLIARATPIGISRYYLAGHYPPANSFKDFIYAGSIF